MTEPPEFVAPSLPSRLQEFLDIRPHFKVHTHYRHVVLRCDSGVSKFDVSRFLISRRNIERALAVVDGQTPFCKPFLNCGKTSLNLFTVAIPDKEVIHKGSLADVQPRVRGHRGGPLVLDRNLVQYPLHQDTEESGTFNSSLPDAYRSGKSRLGPGTLQSGGCAYEERFPDPVLFSVPSLVKSLSSKTFRFTVSKAFEKSILRTEMPLDHSLSSSNNL